VIETKRRRYTDKQTVRERDNETQIHRQADIERDKETQIHIVRERCNKVIETDADTQTSRQ